MRRGRRGTCPNRRGRGCRGYTHACVRRGPRTAARRAGGRRARYPAAWRSISTRAGAHNCGTVITPVSPTPTPRAHARDAPCHDRVACIAPQLPEHRGEQRALARAHGTHDAKQLATAHGDVHVRQRARLASPRVRASAAAAGAAATARIALVHARRGGPGVAPARDHEREGGRRKRRRRRRRRRDPRGFATGCGTQQARRFVLVAAVGSRAVTAARNGGGEGCVRDGGRSDFLAVEKPTAVVNSTSRSRRPRAAHLSSRFMDARADEIEPITKGRSVGRSTRTRTEHSRGTGTAVRRHLAGAMS